MEPPAKPADLTAVVETEPRTTRQRSYGQVLKSSALIGGASVINIAIRIVRTKAMALMIGPAGVGLLGIYDSITELTRSLAGLGINSSGVRQIAEAAGSGDSERIARTVTTLRRFALLTGAMGALLLMLFARPVSRFTFGDDQHTGAIALLALAVLFADVSAAQAALVQGMRRIADLARINILGALFGTVISIPIVYVYREAGVVPSLVAVGAMSIVTSWWFARKVRVERVKSTMQQTVTEVSSLVRLGLAFMSTGLMALGAAYLIRIIVLNRLGVDAAGHYQAAWALGGLYVGFILQAMGADFYPRLTATANNNPECNRLVNEQMEVGLLLAGPGILGTLVFAPLVVQIFYSGQFGPAVELLRWFCLGMMLRIVSWPLGYVLLAKGRAKVFFWSELAANSAQVGMAWAMVAGLGLKGAGTGFFGSYVIYSILIYCIVRKVSGFRASVANVRLGLLFGVLVGVTFAMWYFLNPLVALALGGAITAGASYFSLKTLSSLVSFDRFPGIVRKAIVFLRMVPANQNKN